MPYNREKAIRELKKLTNWHSYGKKHGESIFTKLFQNYILPQRYGFDKRKPHLSSLILSKQISRKEALRELKKTMYDKLQLKNDIKYFCKKMRISESEFERYMKLPLRSYADFNNWDAYYKIMKFIQRTVKKVTGMNLNKYS